MSQNGIRKICVVTGNRADYSRCRSVMRAIRDHAGLQLQTVVTGAHLLPRFGRTVDEVRADGFEPDELVYQIVEGETPTTMARSIGLGICDLSTVFERLRPDVVMVPTDRFETLSAAVAAAAMNIRVAHIQGGEVSGSVDELVRHAITKLSHLHFPATERARQRIIAMGEDPEWVFTVGCPGTDVVLQTPTWDRAQTFESLQPLWKVGQSFSPEQPFLLLLQHPVTTQFEDQPRQMQLTLEAVFQIGLNVISLWPNIDAGSEQMVDTIRAFVREHGAMQWFAAFRHLSAAQFMNVMRHAACMVGNSSAGIRETCYLGTPVVDIGIRQQHRERGQNVMTVPNQTNDIYEAIREQVRHGPYDINPLYGDGRAGKLIAEILATCQLPSIQKILRY